MHTYTYTQSHKREQKIEVKLNSEYNKQPSIKLRMQNKFTSVIFFIRIPFR